MAPPPGLKRQRRTRDFRGWGCRRETEAVGWWIEMEIEIGIESTGGLGHCVPPRLSTHHGGRPSTLCGSQTSEPLRS